MLNSTTIADPIEVPVKKWYQSKTVMLGLGLVAIFGGDLAFGFIGQNVTPEQLDSFNTIYPAGAKIVSDLKSGKSILDVAGAIFGLLVVTVRVWFTNSLIPQSLKK